MARKEEAQVLDIGDDELKLFKVSGFKLCDGGKGYTSVPTVKITGDGLVNGRPEKPAQAKATIAGGRVTGIELIDPGFGYTNEPDVEISGGGLQAKGAYVRALMVEI